LSFAPALLNGGAVILSIWALAKTWSAIQMDPVSGVIDRFPIETYFSVARQYFFLLVALFCMGVSRIVAACIVRPAEVRESRFRFRFSMRAMLVFITIVCITLGWVTIQLKWIHDRHEALKWLHSKDPGDRYAGVVIPHGWKPAPWSIRMFGESEQERLLFDAGMLDEGDDVNARLRWLKRLFPEAEVRAWHSEV
jgi:hypothetical protein